MRLYCIIFLYVVNITSANYFFIWFKLLFIFFILASRTPLSISARADLLVTDTIRFCLLENALFFPSFLKDDFAEYSILFNSFSPQQFLCVLSLPPAAIVSNEISTIKLTGVPWYMMHHFSHVFFKMFLLYFFSIFTMMCLGVNLF